MDIALLGKKSKRGSNVSSSINVSLGGRVKSLPSNDVIDAVSASEQYLKERKNSTKYRLSFQVNVISTNVLCNDITEIVQDEGSENVKCLNFSSSVNDGNNIRPYYKSLGVLTQGDATYNTKNAIRDTQLSNFGFVYHCGKDIFNNHMIRNNTFKSINQRSGGADQNFNTISDYMRNWDGKDTYDYIYLPAPEPSKGRVKIHTYEYDDIDTYSDALLKKKVLDYNGYVGFINKSKLKMYNNEWNTGDELPIDRPIMYKNAGDFIDLYPGRDLFSFVPKYNKRRHRVEKNWNYCITYPSRSIVEGFDFIETRREKNTKIQVNALKALYFDESTKSDAQQDQVVIYSMIPHGLKVDDFVNIYIGSKPNLGVDKEFVKIAISNTRVVSVVDDYIFTVFNPGANLSNKWLETSDVTRLKKADDSYKYSTDGFFVYYAGTDSTDPDKVDLPDQYYVVSSTKRANVDKEAQQLSFKKVDGDNECEYYVRVFSKLPNFKFVEESINENTLYAVGGELIKKYQTKDCEFENHLSKNAFSQNIYGDKNAQIVYTDDIDINYLRDNRNRPLTELFLTVVKNNKGYREWYGVECQQSITSPNVEYSHCFGKVNCAFKYLQEATIDTSLCNVLTLCNKPATSSNGNGINLKRTLGSDTYSHCDNDNDEIDYYNQHDFIGDIVCYHPSSMVEQSLDYVNHRFNTQQRELSRECSSEAKLSTYTYEDIKYDDYDYMAFEVEEKEVKRSNKYEGYYYQPHYRIPVRTFSSLNTVTPGRFTLRTFVNNGGGNIQIVVCGRHNLLLGDKFVMYDSEENKQYTCEVLDIPNASTLTLRCYDMDDVDFQTNITSNDELKERYKFINTTNLNIPSYAELMTDGSCRMQWREVISNGFSTTRDEITEYPFTNGRFYINQNIIIYNRRQDPDGINGLYDESDYSGRIISPLDKDDSYEENIVEC